MPIIGDPGSGGRMEIQALTASGAVIVNNPAVGLPKNLSYQAPYNNLGIPGALTYDIFAATNSNNCASALFANTPNPFFDLVLRNQGANQLTQLQQALVQQPTFVTLWVGNNDVLGYATSGGVSPSAPTDINLFTQLFGGISQQLAASGAQVVVANIPNVSTIPFLTTVGPIMATSVPWSQLALLGVPGLVYQKSTAPGIGIADSASLRNGNALVTLRGSAYASILGDTTGRYYTLSGTQIPTGIDITQPFGFHPLNPWPNSLILDPEELSIAQTAVTSYNVVIQNVANTFNFGLVNINTFFTSIRQADFTGGYKTDGFTFSTAYITGGLFSLDGVHPTSQGQGLIANEFIKVINAKYNASIPKVNIATIPPSLKFTSKVGKLEGYPQVPPEAFEHLLF
jgi:lysophospholipase L1-like esterase